MRIARSFTARKAGPDRAARGPSPPLDRKPLSFAQIPHEATGLSPRAYQVLGILHGRLGGFRPNRNTVDLTDSEIARRAKCTIATVQRALRELEEGRWIRRDHHGGRRHRTITRLFSLATRNGHAMIVRDASTDHTRSTAAAPPQTPPSSELKQESSSSTPEQAGRDDDDSLSRSREESRMAEDPELAAAVDAVRQAHGDDAAAGVAAAVPSVERRMRASDPRLELAFIRACILAGIAETAAKKSFTRSAPAYFAGTVPDVVNWPASRRQAAIDKLHDRVNPQLNMENLHAAIELRGRLASRGIYLRVENGKIKWSAHAEFRPTWNEGQEVQRLKDALIRILSRSEGRGNDH
jgi:hypothetical protein